MLENRDEEERDREGDKGSPLDGLARDQAEQHAVQVQSEPGEPGCTREASG